MKRFGLIGFPLTHSFSATYFSEKFSREGLKDHVYELFPIESISEIRNVISSNPDLLGLNVTIPYKKAVIPYLDSYTSTIPMGIHACNCINIKNGKLTGYNTDIIGFEKSFDTGKLKDHHQKALILGNGGATEAVKYVLEKLGIKYKIVSRQLREGSTSLSYGDLDKKIMDEYTVIINTTPVGTFPKINEEPPIPYDLITSKHYLFDLIYNPSKTSFLEKGEQQGAAIENGLKMLEIQAEESWNIWKR